MVAPILLAEEYQYEDTGVKLNGNVALPFVDITSVDGLDNAPVRAQTTAREGMHGGWVDAEFEDLRTVTFEGTIYAPVNALETYLDSLKANLAPSAVDKPLYIGTDAGTRMLWAKCLGIRYPKQRERSMGAVLMQVQFLCQDPRLYTPDLVSTFLPGTLNLNGNRDSLGTIEIQGDRTNPTITIGSTTFAFNLTIASGSSVVIDLNDRTIIQDGTTNVRSAVTLTGKWPKLQPGANTFTVGGSGTGNIIASSRSAWR